MSPSKGTAARNIRVDDDLWQQVKAEAEKRGEDVSTATRRFWRHYVAGGDVPTSDGGAR